mmetsp:Transcript_34905/g.76187  ORF Transcript_34905/g.76187 Transcript_34905/m.76187 type:complete len:226 (-) Transcript_34905:962-1639(-)
MLCLHLQLLLLHVHTSHLRHHRDHGIFQAVELRRGDRAGSLSRCASCVRSGGCKPLLKKLDLLSCRSLRVDELGLLATGMHGGLIHAALRVLQLPLKLQALREPLPLRDVQRVRLLGAFLIQDISGCSGFGFHLGQPLLEGASFLIHATAHILPQLLEAGRHLLEDDVEQDFSLRGPLGFLHVRLLDLFPVLQELIEASIGALHIELALDVPAIELLCKAVALPL